MEVGQHNALIIGHEVTCAESGAVGVTMQIKFDNGEVQIGRIWMVRKDGGEIEKGIKDVQNLFKWTDGNIETLNAADVGEGIPCTVTVQLEEYNGRALPKINNVWPQRKKADAADIAKIQAKCGAVFKKFATTSGLKPLSASTNAPTAAASAPIDDGKPKPSAVTFDAFKKAVGDGVAEGDVAMLWDDLLVEVTGSHEYDINNIAKPIWAKALKRIPTFIAERKKEVEVDPFA